MNFLIRLFSPIILIISIILFIYTYYKAEIIWNGEKGEFYLTYYTFSISLFFISLITFFLNKSIKEYLILILISITAGLYIFESFLSFKQYLHLNSKVKQYKFKTGKDYDKRTRIEVYNDLKKKTLFKIDKFFWINWIPIVPEFKM